jgi:hypothetical protein
MNYYINRLIIFIIIYGKSLLILYVKIVMNKILENGYPTHFWISMKCIVFGYRAWLRGLGGGLSSRRRAGV